MGFHFRKIVQNIELKRVRGAPKGHPFAPQYVGQLLQEQSQGGDPRA